MVTDQITERFSNASGPILSVEDAYSNLDRKTIKSVFANNTDSGETVAPFGRLSLVSNPALERFDNFINHVPPYENVNELMETANDAIDLQDAETTKLAARLEIDPSLAELRSYSQSEYNEVGNRLDRTQIPNLLDLSKFVYSGQHDQADLIMSALLDSAKGNPKLIEAIHDYRRALTDAGDRKPGLVGDVTAAYDVMAASVMTAQQMKEALPKSDLYRRWQLINGN